MTHSPAISRRGDTIKNPVFAVVFFGLMPAIAAAAMVNWRTSSPVRRALLAVAPMLYVGAMAITFVGNVPLNDALAEIEPSTAVVAGDARADFEDDWNRLNLIRTIAAFGSFVAVAGALAADDRQVVQRRPTPEEQEGFGARLGQTDAL
jgi:uncharacterized membrane protein